jgi:hypothetical protein
MAKLSRIHVNKHVIAKNRKHGLNFPPISIKRGKMNIYAHSVDILGASKVVYSPDKPLKCGARLWIETYAPVLADHWEVM